VCGGLDTFSTPPASTPPLSQVMYDAPAVEAVPPASPAPAEVDQDGARYRAARAKGNRQAEPIDALELRKTDVAQMDDEREGSGKKEAKTRSDENKNEAEARGEGCSDASTRAVADRVPLWRRSLAAGVDPWSVYESASARCEVGDWGAQSTLLDLMAAKADAPQATLVLGALAGDGAARDRFAGSVLRRTTDPALVAAVQGALGVAVDWASLEADLGRPGDAEALLVRVRAAVLRAPSDPRGARLLVRALARAGHQDELRITVQHLRERGVLSPLVAREVGDALAAAGDADEALRTYSEIVEFDPDGAASRLALGDVLLGHGWYDAAYRQYTTLVERGGDARAQIRQAIAAAGAGRTWEALQALRAVAASPSRQADDGPGQWAELWAAAVTADLLEKAPAAGTSLESERDADSLRRRLKELPFFRAPAELVVLTWEDLGARLDLPAAEGQRYDGSAVGVIAVVRPIGSTAPIAPTMSGGAAKVAARVHRIAWDGSAFEVHSESVTLDVPRG
jgi:tetratricopeptide (TPR) repeat protein